MLVVIADSDAPEKRGRKARKISSIIEWFFFSQTSCFSEGNQKSKKFLSESFHGEPTEFRVCIENLKREYDAFSAFNRNLLAGRLMIFRAERRYDQLIETVELRYDLRTINCTMVS